MLRSTFVEDHLVPALAVLPALRYWHDMDGKKGRHGEHDLAVFVQAWQDGPLQLSLKAWCNGMFGMRVGWMEMVKNCFTTLFFVKTILAGIPYSSSVTWVCVKTPGLR